MNQVWLYARQRSDLSALQDQFDCLQRYAVENGLSVVGQSYDTVDSAIRHRPGLQQALDHVRSGDAQIVLTTRLCNISHNNRHVLAFMKALQKSHAKLRTNYAQLNYELYERGLERPLRKYAAKRDGFVPW